MHLHAHPELFAHALRQIAVAANPLVHLVVVHKALDPFVYLKAFIEVVNLNFLVFVIQFGVDSGHGEL